MSIAATLASAQSGLQVAARRAEIVSSNIANALTEGYGRRVLEVSARSVGSAGHGVQAVAVLRVTDKVVLGERRLAEADSAASGARAAFLTRLESALGTPGEEGSLAARIAAFDAALLAAASRPDNETRLAAVADTARGVTAALASATRTVQSAREDSDAAAAALVRRINDALEGVARINAQIVRIRAAGHDAAALMDQRQQLVDGIAPLIPLREVDRGDGQIALYTASGATLLDGLLPSRLGFTASPVITPDMSLQSGALSGLTLNGRPAGTGPGGALAGGELAAMLAVRDTAAPAAQAALDALARDLAERFSAPGLDPTLAPGAAGLFTDAGAAPDPGAETGLAGRLALNAAADPARGGALWRLRDGLGAATPGAPCDPALIEALHGALTALRTPASGAFTAAPRSLPGLAAAVVSAVAADRLTAEADLRFTAARADTLRVAELQRGVDTDAELQDLMAIEQAYAANARVVQAVDEMLGRLMEI